MSPRPAAGDEDRRHNECVHTSVGSVLKVSNVFTGVKSRGVL